MACTWSIPEKGDGGKDTNDQRRESRERDGEPEDASIDGDLVQTRHHRSAERDLKRPLRMRRRELAQQLHSAHRQQRTDDATTRREHDALGEQLSDDASTAGAEGQANRDLAVPRRAAREQQTRHVGTDDEQHDADRDGERREARAGSPPRSAP